MYLSTACAETRFTHTIFAVTIEETAEWLTSDAGISHWSLERGAWCGIPLDACAYTAGAAFAITVTSKVVFRAGTICDEIITLCNSVALRRSIEGAWRNDRQIVLFFCRVSMLR